MNTTSAKILVYVGDKFACIKIVGRANFTSSIDFKTLVNELRQKGYGYFVLDLSECTLMDSTFLGVLAGFGMKMSAGQQDQQDGAIQLLNPNARIVELLENLGVLHLFKLTQGPRTLPQGTEAQARPPANPSQEELIRTCLAAHETLMAIKP